MGTSCFLLSDPCAVCALLHCVSLPSSLCGLQVLTKTPAGQCQLRSDHQRSTSWSQATDLLCPRLEEKSDA
jgi:hypothetical protein